MPTYEYLCQACSNRFEKWQKMTDEPLTTCPECGGHIRRVLYPTGVVFKGSGFYKTDYNANSKNAAQQHTSSESSEKKSESTTTETSTTSSESKAGTNGSSEKAAPATTTAPKVEAKSA